MRKNDLQELLVSDGFGGRSRKRGTVGALTVDALEQSVRLLSACLGESQTLTVILLLGDCPLILMLEGHTTSKWRWLMVQYDKRNRRVKAHQPTGSNRIGAHHLLLNQAEGEAASLNPQTIF